MLQLKGYKGSSCGFLQVPAIEQPKKTMLDDNPLSNVECELEGAFVGGRPLISKEPNNVDQGTGGM